MSEGKLYKVLKHYVEHTYLDPEDVEKEFENLFDEAKAEFPLNHAHKVFSLPRSDEELVSKKIFLEWFEKWFGATP